MATSTSVVGAEVVTGLILLGVTLVLALAGEQGAVFIAHDATVVTGGVVEAFSHMVELEFNGHVCSVFSGVVVKLDGLAWTVFTGADVVVGVGFGEGEAELGKVGWMGGGVEITGDEAEACGESITATVLVVKGDFTVVFTAAVIVAVFDTVVVVVVVMVAAGSASTTMADDSVGGRAATGVATVVALAECGPAVFTVVETEEFGSTAASEAVETSTGFTLGGVDVTTLAGGGDGAVAVTGTVAHGDRKDTWEDDAESRLVAGAEPMTWMEAASERGAGAADAWTEAATRVEV